MLLKVKRDGSIKGRGCCDGRKRKECTTKEETIPPMITQEGLIMSCIIDEMKDCDMYTNETTLAFLQNEMESMTRERLDLVLAKYS